MSLSHEMIPLRSMSLVFNDSDTLYGVCLPDGRFIINMPKYVVATFSSESWLLRFNPGATLVWNPQMDEAINNVGVE